MAFVEVRELTRIYRGVGSRDRDQVVFKDYSLDIERGETVAVVGPSGCGKSTLLHVIGGLDSPRRREVRKNGNDQEIVTVEGAGRVLVDDQAIWDMDPPDRANFINRHVGFVFQFHHLIPELTAVENVMLPLQIHGTPPSQARARAVELLANVGLAGDSESPDKTKALPAVLSGGERQRVAIARALANRPRLLLADEPTGSLDPVRKREVFDLLKQLTTKTEATVLLVTHDHGLLKDGDGKSAVDREVDLDTPHDDTSDAQREATP